MSHQELYEPLLNVIEFLGTFAFAISGIRHAAAKHFDWFGGFVCGIAVAIGGGTLRDMMLGVTPFWMTSSIYLICTLIAQMFVIIFAHSLKRLDNTWFFFDTLGLALYGSGLAEDVRLRTSLLGSHHHGHNHRFGGRRNPRRAPQQRASNLQEGDLRHGKHRWRCRLLGTGRVRMRHDSLSNHRLRAHRADTYICRQIPHLAARIAWRGISKQILPYA